MSTSIQSHFDIAFVEFEVRIQGSDRRSRATRWDRITWRYTAARPILFSLFRSPRFRIERPRHPALSNIAHDRSS